MEPSLGISIFGLLIFSTIVHFGLKYASGKWNVPESKKSQYIKWTGEHGSTLKKGLIVISVIYGVSMLLQILSLI